MSQPTATNLSPAEARLCQLLRRGYFPAELPPPFTTRKFASHAIELAGVWKGAEVRKFWTAPEHYTIPRHGQMRRKLSLVNPVNQHHVAHLISENWESIQRRLQRSDITEFRPEINLTGGGRAVTGVDFDAVARKRAQILARYGRYIKTDIARFYPSVYTHSIAWSLLDKNWVKNHHRERSFTLSFANHLDRSVAAGQSGQTVGIPIGPDTSRILSELIATELEVILRMEIPDLDLRAVRYVDDILIGFSDNEAPDTLIAKLSTAFYQYELELNGDKTSMHGLGYTHAPEWQHFIRHFSVSDRVTQQREDLDSFFGHALHLSDANPRENVLLFAAKRAASFDIADNNWIHLVQNLLYVAKRSGTCLSFVVQYLSLEQKLHNNLPIDQIREYVHRELNLRADAAHTGELSWLLFWARELKIALNSSVLEKILLLRSSVCALLVFDLRQRGLINGTLDTSFWSSFVSEEGLKSEMWLVSYEATKKGWGPGAVEARYITDHKFFSELWNRDVEFYEPTYESRPQIGDPFFAMIAKLAPGLDYGGYP